MNFFRRHWKLILPGIALYVALAWHWPLLWGVFNAELGIGIWLAHGFTPWHAFCIACIFGNIECICWNRLIGWLILKQREKVIALYKAERTIAEHAGLGYYIAVIREYIAIRFDPDRYTRHWAFRALTIIREHALVKFLAQAPFYALVVVLCAAPTFMFPVMAFAHIARIPQRRIFPAILGGNTLKMAFFAFGLWPAVRAGLILLWSAFFGN